MQKPEEQNFRKILDSNKDRIFRICKIYAVSPIEPQDLFQEVVFQIWKSISTFKGKSNINTWIYKITLNVCSRYKMNFENGNNNTVRLDSIEFKLAEAPQDTHQEERYKALRYCISLLKESHQSLIILHLDELAHKEIATVTGLTENHIAVKMKRVREILLNCITPKLK